MTNERDWEAAARQRLERQVAATVQRVRDAADEMERQAKRDLEAAVQGTYEWSTHTYAVGRVVHVLHTLLFNTNADSMISAASDADRARWEKHNASCGHRCEEGANCAGGEQA